jgi:uncharacterized protein YuzE
MPNPKLCKDCRWAYCLASGGEDNPIYWECHHDSSRTTDPPDLVVGRPAKVGRLFCSEARTFKTDHKTNEPLCGRDGRFWEPRDDFEPPVTEIIGFGEPPPEYSMTYDAQADVVSIIFAGGPSEGEEVHQGVILHFDADNRIVEIEITSASKVLARLP